jgi:hypothetical protein
MLYMPDSGLTPPQFTPSVFLCVARRVTAVGCHHCRKLLSPSYSYAIPMPRSLAPIVRPSARFTKAIMSCCRTPCSAQKRAISRVGRYQFRQLQAPADEASGLTTARDWY